MISMEPVLKRGYTAWDQDVLPADEFAERLAAVRSEIRSQNLDALVIVNYSLLGAMVEYADIAYLGGLQSGGVLLVTDDGDPTLISFGGGRELFFMRDQTWTANVLPGRGRSFEVVREQLAERGIASGNIGTVGLGGMPPAAVERFNVALAGFRLAPFDPALARLRAAKRPRELLAIGIAKRIVDGAAAAAAGVFADGGDNTAAMLEAERVARFNKARDIRVLATMQGGELRPFEGRDDGRYSPLLVWVAAQYQGYWAETTIASPAVDQSPAQACVDAMSAAVRSGATAGGIAEAGLAELPKNAVDAALSYGLGGTIGLHQNEGFVIRPGDDSRLDTGSVVSLVTVAPGATGTSIASAMLVVQDDTAIPLKAVETN